MVDKNKISYVTEIPFNDIVEIVFAKSSKIFSGSSEPHLVGKIIMSNQKIREIRCKNKNLEESEFEHFLKESGITVRFSDL